jgi:transcriptional regulator with XRE-family HTH domain
MKAKKTGEAAEAPASAEVRQLMDLLRTLARAMGYSNAALARRANVALASLVRYFKGDAEPRLEFVLLVVRAIGLDVREFFEMAYPERETPTEARQRLEKILGPIRPGRVLESPPTREPGPLPEVPSEATPLRREDIERMLDDLRRDVREIMESQSRKAADPEAKPRKKNGDG